MTKRGWVAGVLVVLAAAGGYLAGFFQDDIHFENKWGVTCAPAIALFDQKRRCGHTDMGLVTMTGTAIRTKIHNDGDFSVNVLPDLEHTRLLYYGGVKNKDYVHVEFMPCERRYPDVEGVLQQIAKKVEGGEKPRVRVTGRWAFDGVDHRGDWEEQVGKCLETREPDPALGWVEIHPAYFIEILETNG